MSEATLLEAIDTNTDAIAANIIRLNNILSEDGLTGEIPELDATMVQAIYDINAWVTNLAALLNSKHDDQQDEIDLVTIRVVSNEFDLAALGSDTVAGIIYDINQAMIAADSSITALFNAYVLSNDAEIVDHDTRIQTMELLFGNLLNDVDFTTLTAYINATEERLVIQYTALIDPLDVRVTNQQAEILVNAGLVAINLADILTLDDSTTDRFAAVEITTDAIELSVSSLTTTHGGLITDNSASISIHDDSINTVVSRVDTILNEAGTSGWIKTLESRITQTASDIALEVIARTALADGEVATNSAWLTIAADSIVNMVTTTDNLTERMSTAETNITANEITMSVTSVSLADTQDVVGSMFVMTNNKIGMTVSSSSAGVPYITGMEIIMYPPWFRGSAYTTAHTVTTSGQLHYTCILAHTATIDNHPTGLDGATYWTAISLYTTNFVIKADKFTIITSTGSKEIFSVTADEVSIKSDVNIEGSLLISPKIIANDLTAQGYATTSYNAGKTYTEGWSDENADVTASSISGVDISAAKAAGHTLVQGGYLATDIIMVDTAQIVSGAITTAKIGNLQVDTAQIKNLAIETLKIADNAVSVSMFMSTALMEDTLAITLPAGSSVFITVAMKGFSSTNSKLTYTGPSSQSGGMFWQDNASYAIQTYSMSFSVTSTGTYYFKHYMKPSSTPNGFTMEAVALIK